ncbi:hypothetical protein AJ78_06068 [Emergomyces pasteurianus Ep9510]|uniref:Uncharacterized protein n=1 Tax=Emergomyces pasteurianus Ep9510 TaxID=1447872 RepID=A0A1J9PBR4_9EURO|nr:hypothetical protein AJ78_06068 [Emergomyces pasteurianus Ep9510]
MPIHDSAILDKTSPCYFKNLQFQQEQNCWQPLNQAPSLSAQSSFIFLAFFASKQQNSIAPSFENFDNTIFTTRECQGSREATGKLPLAILFNKWFLVYLSSEFGLLTDDGEREFDCSHSNIRKMHTVNSPNAHPENRGTQETANAQNPVYISVQGPQQPPDLQSSCIGHHTPISGSIQHEELTTPMDVNGSEFGQGSVTNNEHSFVWSTIMPHGDHELGTLPPYIFQSRTSQPFHYDSPPKEQLGWNAEHLQCPRGMNTLHSPSGSFSVISQSSWTEPSCPASYSSPELVNYTEDANVSASQMSSVPDPCARLIDTDNHSTSVGHTTRAPHSLGSATDGANYAPHPIGNGCSPMSLTSKGTRGKTSPGRKVSRYNLSSGSSCPSSSKKELQFQENKRPFVEHTFHASSGEPAAMGSRKRRRTKDEKQETALIRELGGACEVCRKKHRRCSREHHRRKDTRSTQNVRNVYSENSNNHLATGVHPQTSAYSPNFQETYQMMVPTLSASNSSATASSPATQRGTEEMATRFNFQARDESFDCTTNPAKVEGQPRDTRNAIPARAVSIVQEQSSLGLSGNNVLSENNVYGIQDGYDHLDETNIDSYQLAANENPDIFNDIEENLDYYLSLLGDVFEGPINSSR